MAGGLQRTVQGGKRELSIQYRGLCESAGLGRVAGMLYAEFSWAHSLYMRARACRSSLSIDTSKFRDLRAVVIVTAGTPLHTPHLDLVTSILKQHSWEGSPVQTNVLCCI